MNQVAKPKKRNHRETTETKAKREKPKQRNHREKTDAKRANKGKRDYCNRRL